MPIIPSSKTTSDPLRDSVEIIPERLYYAAVQGDPRLVKSKKRIHYFSIDQELTYWNFFLDFGPLNLGQLYRFCSKLNGKLEDARLRNRIICFYSHTTPSKRANATFLICAWQILYLNRTPGEAYRGFRPDVPMQKRSNEPLPPFHDASPCTCTYDLTVMDCLRGLAKARMYRYFDFDNFPIDEYEYYEQVEYGDLNWIMQDKIIAFAGPHYRRQMTAEGYCTLTPAEYIPYFTKKNVRLVVRLNKKCYDETDFTDVGINHVEHYYLDGSCPPMNILHDVLEAFESCVEGAFAVHCKAGLGRTGTCIGAYMMKHYKFTAPEAIGWMRICRPGCVIGPQQHFLQEIEQRMWYEGDLMRLRPSRPFRRLDDDDEKAEKLKASANDANVDLKIPTLPFQSLSVNDYSFKSVTKQERGDAVEGRPGQGNSLLTRRAQNHQLTLGDTRQDKFASDRSI